jgi:hypothetical protein
MLVKHLPQSARGPAADAGQRRGPIVLLAVSLTVELAWIALLAYVLYHFL